MLDLLHQFPWEMATYFALSASFLSFWLSEGKTMPLILFLTSIIVGLIAGSLNYLSIISIFAFAALTYGFYQKDLSKTLKVVVFATILLLTVLSFLHMLPGYNNWQIYPSIKLSEKSAAFPLWFNFDKPLIAFFLLFFAYDPVRNVRQYKNILIKTLPFFLILSLFLSIFGALLGYAVFDPKLPEFKFILLWIFKMLFFTVLAEEIFFRFFIQNSFITLFGRLKNGEMIGLILAAILFGLFHFSGGISFVLLATVSGFLYGMVYLRTKCLESAILLHFAVNVLHFFFFSYPYYDKS
jgi:membrane protease YdiL (CAAX protease family)